MTPEDINELTQALNRTLGPFVHRPPAQDLTRVYGELSLTFSKEQAGRLHITARVKGVRASQNPICGVDTFDLCRSLSPEVGARTPAGLTLLRVMVEDLIERVVKDAGVTFPGWFKS